MKVLLDTSPLYALVERRDQGHDRALELFGRLAEERADLSCPLPTALELHSLLLKRKPSQPQEAHETVRKVLGVYPLVFPLQEDAQAALGWLERYADQRMTLTDVILASMARRLEAQVLTFDLRHLASHAVPVSI